MSLKEGQVIPEQTDIFEVRNTIHRHWATYLKHIFVASGLIIAPLIIPSIISYLISRVNSNLVSVSFISFFTNPETSKISIVIFSAYLLTILGYFLYTWIDYYLDVTIITKDHLVNIRQDGLFSRTISEQSLLRIQDVSAKVSGPIQSMFNYGTVFVETAGEQPNFKMINIPDPHVIARIIMRISEELLNEYDVSEDLKTGIGIEKKIRKKTDNETIPLEAKKYSESEKTDQLGANESKVIEVNLPKKNNKPTDYKTPKVEKIINNTNSIEKPELSWISGNKSNLDDNQQDSEQGELKEGKNIKL